MDFTKRYTPEWDARQEYSKHLIEMLTDLKHVAGQDFLAWYRLIRNYYSITQAFMSSEDKNKCKFDLLKINELLIKSKTQQMHNYKDTMESMLYDTTDNVISATSHLLNKVNNTEELSDNEDWL